MKGHFLNTGDFAIGNSTLTGVAGAHVESLENTGGALIALDGGDTGEATLDDESAAPETWHGGLSIKGHAVVMFEDGGGIETIAADGEIGLTRADAVLSATFNKFLNSALDHLSVIDGGLRLTQAVKVAVAGNLNNGLDSDSGGIGVDFARGAGSELTIGGTLTNNGDIGVGNNADIGTTKLATAGGLDNTAERRSASSARP